jgi:predicted permease
MDASDVNSPGAVIVAVLPAYMLILLGAVLRRVKILRSEHDESAMHVVFHVMYPCFILSKMLGSEALRNGSVVAWSIGIGFSELLVGGLVGFLFGILLRLEKGNGLRTFAFSVGIQNFGFTAIPIVQQLWGDAAVAVLIVHNLGVELSIWTVGVMLMSNDKRIPWKKLINGPAISVVLGLILVGLRVDRYFVGNFDFYLFGPMREAMKWLGNGAFPLALVITGALMFDMVRVEKPSARIALGGSVLRLLVIPLIILAAAKWLPLSLELRQVLVVQAAMPAAMSPLLIAKLYGGRPGIAAQIIVASTVISLFTLPWVIAFGMKWILP